MCPPFQVYWLEAASCKILPCAIGKGRSPGEEFRKAPRSDSSFEQLGSQPRMGSFEIDNLDSPRLRRRGMSTFEDQISVQPGVPEVQEPVDTQRIAEAPGKKFAIPDVPDPAVMTQARHEFAHGTGPRFTLKKNGTIRSNLRSAIETGEWFALSGGLQERAVGVFPEKGLLF